MGRQVISSCQCGLKDGSWIGGGFDEDHEYMPCLCEGCHSVVQVDLCAKRKLCPKCNSTTVIPYTDPSLAENGQGPGDWNQTFFQGGAVAEDRHYKCPRCGHMTLNFKYTDLCWD